MTDFYLKFADEAEANTILEGLTDYSIDVVGTIYKQTGVDVNGLPVLLPITGWHVNLRGADTDIFEIYKATPDPTTPYRTWA